MKCIFLKSYHPRKQNWWDNLFQMWLPTIKVTRQCVSFYNGCIQSFSWDMCPSPCGEQQCVLGSLFCILVGGRMFLHFGRRTDLYMWNCIESYSTIWFYMIMFSTSRAMFTMDQAIFRRYAFVKWENYKQVQFPLISVSTAQLVFLLIVTIY